jgi:ADP-heptose:LPS heptosyltransferase
MHVIKIPECIEKPVPTLGGRPMEAGKEYICTNAFAGQMMCSRWRVVIAGEMWSLRLLMRVRHVTFFPFDPTQDWNNKDIWLYRGGGWGDLLMMTPLIREMKAMWPKARIHVACGSDYSRVFDGMGIIPELLPIPEEARSEIDALIEFEEIIEGDPSATRYHMAQLLANRAGITLTSLRPEYRVTEEEREWALDKYPRNSLPRIGVQCLASAFYRTYADMGKVMVELSREADVYLIGAPGQIKTEGTNEHVHNLMEDKCSFRESAAVVSTCDACVSPDSALVHLCSALDIPCVALYGPFPSELRVTSDKCFAFNGKAHCAPCFFHAEIPNEFPYGMPCYEGKKCIALESIDYRKVVEKTLSLARPSFPFVLLPHAQA